MTDYFITWWNVENLFDTFDSPKREDWLQKKLKGELKDWDANILKKKISQLGKIIKQMNNDSGPDILGVCEIENRKVLEDLIKELSTLPHNYDIAHADTKDGRDIDVGFIYDKNKFNVNETYSHFVLKRTTTRDLFQVNMETTSGNELILIGNHWPARSGGVYKTEPYRILVAETLAYWHERIVEIKGKDVPILSMDDLNDEPFNRSVVDNALSWKSLDKVKKSTLPKFYNLMWEVLGKREGTFYFDGFPYVFDQFMVSKGMIQSSAKIKVREDSINIFMPEEMVSSDYTEPIPFKRPSHKDYNSNGYSDHYPICMVIQEK